MPLTRGLRAVRDAFGGENRRLLKEAFHRAEKWAHPLSALFAVATDVIKKSVPHCMWLLLGASTALVVVMMIVVRSRRAMGRFAATFTAFCSVAALGSVIVIGLENLSKGDEDGVVMDTLRRIEDTLNRIEGSVKDIKESLKDSVLVLGSVRQEQKHQHDVLVARVIETDSNP